VARSNRSRSRRPTAAKPGVRGRKPGTTARLIRAGEVATALAAIAGLLFLIGDRLSGGDESGAAKGPRLLDVEVSDINIDHPVKYRSFLQTIDGLERFKAGARANGVPMPAVQARLDVPGVEIGFRLRVDGPPGRRLELTPKVYKAHGRIAAPLSPLAPVETEHYTSEAQRDLGVSSTWAAYPAAPGEYYVELRVDELIGKRREFRVRERTENFRVEA
jgi:hypothetical protein